MVQEPRQCVGVELLRFWTEEPAQGAGVWETSRKGRLNQANAPDYR
jgi:hypothetical protein